MNEPFVLEITYRQQQYELPAAFQRDGFTYRIALSIAETPYIFEPDEEGSYRVLTTDHPDLAVADSGLLKAIAERLQQLGR